VRLYGPYAVLKDVGLPLLEYGCQARAPEVTRMLAGRIGGTKGAETTCAG